MNTKKLHNNKYFVGSYKEFEKTKGWFIGSFFDDDNNCKTDKIEIQYKEQPVGHICKKHYHEHKVEIMLMLEGKAVYTINNKAVEIKAGQFIFMDVNNVTRGEFLENSKYFAIHAPSIPTDKISMEN